VSRTTDATRLRDAIVAKVLSGQPAALRFLAAGQLVPAPLFSVVMGAVAGARARLAQKGAGLDVAVMPLAASAPAGAAAGAADGAEGGGRGADKLAAGSSSSSGSSSADDKQQRRRRAAAGGRVFSLRLVPLTATQAAAGAADAPAAEE
jgi:hypothetical protein